MCCCFFVFDSSPLTASVSGSPLGLKRMREESARSNMVPAEGFGRRCVGVVLWAWAWAWVCECVCPGDNIDDGDDILIIYSFLFEFFFDNHQVDDTILIWLWFFFSFQSFRRICNSGKINVILS